MNIYLEIFGYIGTFLVLMSMMMTTIKKLRIVNICGSAISFTYSMLMVSYPPALLNLGVIVINIGQLIKERIKGEKNETDN